MTDLTPVDRNLALELVRVTEAAAIAAAAWIGRGDKNAADGAAVEAMRKAFDTVAIDGTVVIGEGERDEAPMLYIGEKVGLAQAGAPKIDIALDPLEDRQRQVANPAHSIRSRERILSRGFSQTRLHLPGCRSRQRIGRDLRKPLPLTAIFARHRPCFRRPMVLQAAWTGSLPAF